MDGVAGLPVISVAAFRITSLIKRRQNGSKLGRGDGLVTHLRWEGFVSGEMVVCTIFLRSVIFPYSSLYARAVACTTCFQLGETVLGFALGRVLTDQFSEWRGLRPKADGLPRILVVLTDGESDDDVSTPAKTVRDNEITIYAVGVAGYNLEQLKEIAPSDQHVITLDSFSKLDAFVSTITSSACYEPRASGNNETITTNVKKGSFKYFSYKVNPAKNLEVSVDDLVGSTMLYASRTTPHPYKYDHDYKLERASQKDKVIVTGENATSPRPKRSTGNNLQPIYIAVTSDTDSAKFTIVANDCDPSVCVEGTSGRRSGSSKNYSKFPWVFLLGSILVLLNNYY